MAELRDGDTLYDWMLARATNLTEAYTKRDNGEDPKVLVDCGIQEVAAAGIPERGLLTVLAAHAGHGKSAVAAGFLEGAARQGYGAVGFFFEDPAEMLTDRTFSKYLKSSATDLRQLKTISPNHGRLASAKEMEIVLGKVTESAKPWATRVRMFSNKMTVTALFERIEWLIKTVPNLALIVVDYAQIFISEDESKEHVIDVLATRLAGIARDHHLAILLLSQVNTNKVMERGQQRLRSWWFNNREAIPDRAAIEGFVPVVGDLMWAPGALQQRARSVLFAFRPAVILNMLKVPTIDDVIELVFGKNNYGPTPDPVLLRWIGMTASVMSMQRPTGRLNASL
jgi:replicative DNA helicase